jgi:integrating conjugative element protein (TIGR03749 family)
MIFKRLGFVMMALLVSTLAMAKSSQHVVWDKTPIHITLPLNQERQIQFPLAITIVDSDLDEHLDVVKNQDVLYLNALKEFTNKRLVVQLMPYGEVIVLTVSAKKEATDVTPIEVVVAAREDEQEVASQGTEESAPDTAKASEFNPVLLTRYAIQSLYSPERLLITPPGIIRTAMRTHKHIALVNKASVLARPLISWQGGDLYVTAVELKNELKKEVEIKPTDLVGNWQTASFFPTNLLQPRGQKDTTTVFVVSDRPFGEALSQIQGFVR